MTSDYLIVKLTAVIENLTDYIIIMYSYTERSYGSKCMLLA